MRKDPPQAEHVPVLLDEVVDALGAVLARPSARVVDATFGRGGHSRALLERMSDDGALLAIDRDPAAASVARDLQSLEPRFSFCAAAFSSLDRCVTQWLCSATPAGDAMVDAVLMDLGVSSPQLDDADRGFSFQHDGPLDMRMDPSSGVPASVWLAEVDEEELAKVLFEYGEERDARRIARAIVQDRATKPFDRTTQLAALIARVVRRRTPGRHPATKSFQAIRIAVNRELDELREGIEAAVRVLRPQGRLAVISFHSLEDRWVKQRMRGDVGGPNAADARRLARNAPWLPAPRHDLRAITGAVRASAAELVRNPRSRSATLRIAERVA
ncbi:MAG: 16S rRNA (cytosine(1402)-N(4))-methyltransferase RsmH [Thioalkalivibrionaceae bacterium]